ncbi:MAG: DUF2911 domain-containing protein [Gemmatimonadaceae bacterium]
MKPLGKTLGWIAPLLLHAPLMRAQTGGFIATLGRDTVHAENFERKGDTLRGTIVTRVPTTRVTNYTMIFGPNGKPARYDIAIDDANGVPLTTNGSQATLTWRGDSIIRDMLQNGARVSGAVYAPYGAFPSPGIPYIGVSYLMYEYAFAAAREKAEATDARIQLLAMFNGIPVEKKRIWFVGSDSAEADYFGVARSGYRFDKSGQLIRADWRGTTYRYVIARVAKVDTRALIDKWKTLDGSGSGIGALSPLDTSRGSVGSAALMVVYSRPSQRGRDLWGTVVTPTAVWRLGADMATHFTTSENIVVGDSIVPAGRYTLWMQYMPNGEAYLVVNKAVNVFGTQYRAQQDLVHIPLKRMNGRPQTERLTIGIADNALQIRWGDVTWVAPIKVGR